MKLLIMRSSAPTQHPVKHLGMRSTKTAVTVSVGLVLLHS